LAQRVADLTGTRRGILDDDTVERRRTVVELPRENMDEIVKRLRRAQGQIGGVLKMIDEGRDCEDIVTQVAAASRALDRAGIAIIATGLKQCLLDSGGVDSVDSDKMQKLFLSLA
jgi:DNA-binding FrmR family transcriptional regulator